MLLQPSSPRGCDFGHSRFARASKHIHSMRHIGIPHTKQFWRCGLRIHRIIEFTCTVGESEDIAIISSRQLHRHISFGCSIATLFGILPEATMKHCHYPSIQRASASDSPRSALLRKALSRLDETIYHIYNNNEEDANKRVIATAASILQLPQIICLSDDVVAMGHGSGPQPAASTPDTEESLDTDIGGFGDAGGPGADGKDDGVDDEDDERTIASALSVESVAITTPIATKTTQREQLVSTAKRGNLNRSLEEQMSRMDVTDDEKSTDSAVDSSVLHRAILCTEPPDTVASPMSMRSVVDASNSKSDEDRIIATVMYLRLHVKKTSVPLDIDILKEHFPSLLPFINELLTDIDDSTYATRENLADCDNEMAESRFLDSIQPKFYRECFDHKLRGKTYEGERRLYRMLKLLVQSKNAEVLSVLDSKDGKAMVENQSKLFPCSHCGLLFTRNNIMKHSQCVSLDAKLPIQECLSNKLRYFAKLLESDSCNLGRNEIDAIACAAVKLSELKDAERKKLRRKFPHFSRFEKALAENTKVALPNDKMLLFQQG